MAGELSPTAPLQPPSYYPQLGKEHPLVPIGRTALLSMGNRQGTGIGAEGSQPQLQAAHKLTCTGVKQLWPLTTGVSHASPTLQREGAQTAAPPGCPPPRQAQGRARAGGQHAQPTKRRAPHRSLFPSLPAPLPQICQDMALQDAPSSRHCHSASKPMHLAGAHHAPSCTLRSNGRSFSTWEVSPHGLGVGAIDTTAQTFYQTTCGLQQS